MISGVKIPDSKIAREAAELVRQHESEMLFNHSVRVFLFGAMKGANFSKAMASPSRKRIWCGKRSPYILRLASPNICGPRLLSLTRVS